MAQTRNTGPAAARMVEVKRCNTNRPEASMNRFHKGISRIQIRIGSFM
jgi:hypothetical protein